MEDKELSGRVLSGFKWTYVSAAVHAASHLVVLSALAHLLDKRHFGLLSLALVFTSLAERVGQIGIGPSVVQRAELTRRHVTTATTLSLLTGLVIFASLYVAAPWAGSFFRDEELVPVLRAVAAVFVFDGVGMVSESLLQRELRFKALAAVENGAYILGSGVVGVTLAWAGYGVWALVAGTLVQRTVRTGALLLLEPPDPRLSFHRTEASELVRTGFGYSLGRLLNYAALNGDNAVVGRLMGTADVGVYGRAYQLMTLPATYIGQVLDKVLFPAMSKRQADRTKLRGVYLHGTELVALLTLPLGALMYLTAPEIVRVLFGPQWGEVVPVFGVLALGVFFRTGYKNSDTVGKSLGVVYRHAWRQAAYAVLVVTGAVVGVHAGGLVGVAWGVLAAVVLNYVMMATFAAGLLGVPGGCFVKAHVPGLVVTCTTTALAVPVVSFLRSAGAPSLVVVGAGAVCLAAGLSVVVLGSAGRILPEWAGSGSVTWILGRLGVGPRRPDVKVETSG